eukprot:972324_1
MIRNNANNNDGHGQNGSNNNDSSGDEDEKAVSMSQSAPCNHLNTCCDCRLQIKTQDALHQSFVERLLKVIANAKQKANRKSKPKNRRKPTNTTKVNQPSYCPPVKAARHLRVGIPNTLVENEIQQTVKEPIASRQANSYVYKSIVMQRNDKQLFMDQKNVVIDVDLHEEKSNESLYCVMSRIQHERCNWQLHKKLYTKPELVLFQPFILPQSSRIALQDSITFSPSFLNTQSVNDIIPKWNTIPVFTITNNTKRLTLLIQQSKLNPMIKRTLLNVNTDKIPILMFDGESHWVEHVFIVKIDMSRHQLEIDICISLRCDADGVRITG